MVLQKRTRANSSEIWTKPLNPRYMWITISKTEIRKGLTYVSLKQAMDKTPKKELVSVLLVDMNEENVVNITKKVTKFMFDWRDNYHDEDWKFIVDKE